MARTPDRAGGEGSPPPPRLTLVRFGREEINPDALDYFLVRLFREITRLISVAENVKNEQLEDDDVRRERHTRIVASIQRMFVQIVRDEVGRAAARMSRNATHDEDARRSLEAHIDRVIEQEFKKANLQVPG